MMKVSGSEITGPPFPQEVAVDASRATGALVGLALIGGAAWSVGHGIVREPATEPAKPLLSAVPIPEAEFEHDRTHFTPDPYTTPLGSKAEPVVAGQAYSWEKQRQSLAGQAPTTGGTPSGQRFEEVVPDSLEGAEYYSRLYADRGTAERSPDPTCPWGLDPTRTPEDSHGPAAR